MFTSLKNKIKEETGNEVPSLPNNRTQRFSIRESLNSQSSFDDLSLTEQRDAEITALRSQINQITQKWEAAEEQKCQYEKDNLLLEESVRLAQTQKDIIYEEQDKIQNLQSQELTKLKSLLVFREQEALDRLSLHKQTQQQVDNLKNELLRVKKFEPMLEEVQDELEHLRHESQMDKNNLITNLAAVKEENRHLQSRLRILEDSRINFSANLPLDEKIDTLVKERKLLEQRLEEAHLHLSDVKSTWSGQNLALETQLSRLSRQVAEETNEKRKAFTLLDELNAKLKKYEIDLDKLELEVVQRNNKIKILEDEIEDLSTALKETRIENEEEITFLRNKVEENKIHKNELTSQLSVNDSKFNDAIETAEKNTQELKQELSIAEEQYRELTVCLEKERQEKRAIQLKNVEISQSEDIFKQELRLKRDELNEFNDRINSLLEESTEREITIKELCKELDDVKLQLNNYRDKQLEYDTIKDDLIEKSKTIKTLNQRLTDMKKTLQNEIKKPSTTTINKICIEHDDECNNRLIKLANGNGIVMDEVNFKYLKHVIVKFLTSREVEARHLIRAVATLLHLSNDEEKLLHDTLNWKMSWFGSKPDHGTGQSAISIPPGL